MSIGTDGPFKAFLFFPQRRSSSPVDRLHGGADKLAAAAAAAAGHHGRHRSRSRSPSIGHGAGGHGVRDRRDLASAGVELNAGGEEKRRKLDHGSRQGAGGSGGSSVGGGHTNAGGAPSVIDDDDKSDLDVVVDDNNEDSGPPSGARDGATVNGTSPTGESGRPDDKSPKENGRSGLDGDNGEVSIVAWVVAWVGVVCRCLDFTCCFT